ncbi:TetR family transcriptional regulator [Streptomyces sp. B1866]|uniref:TetR/AcrR family transcriptional regulator n=1 Tax=Streptomyces sp. B1866 TaxID=3075431 RepID=UPI00288FEBB9|nr:TetR family transcriptional regulator [Streptomyces sp. B1866]MDT3399752.1 TetR family transcriptional regulator [Streptomyces sp. B1866]
MTAERTQPVTGGTVGRPGRGPVRKRTGRRPGATESRGTILDCARRLFADHGYDGVSVRAIAKAAGVDAALVHHFFASKEGLFNASMEDAVRPEMILDPVLAGGVDGLGERLVRAFLRHWEEEPTQAKLRSILRSAVSHPTSAEMVRGYVVRKVLGRVAEVAGGPHPEVRAGLVASQLVGLALSRYVVEIEPLASLHSEAVVAAVGPNVQRYLTGELPEGCCAEGTEGKEA